MAAIIFLEASGASHSVRIKRGTTIMESAVAGGVPGIEAQCYGAGVCATCHVRVDDAAAGCFPPPTEWEAEMLAALPLVNEHSRLACQLRFEEQCDGATFRLPERQDVIG